jgi:hypothetical protein
MPENRRFASLFIVAIVFLMLKAVAKKAKSIVTLSLPKWRKFVKSRDQGLGSIDHFSVSE